MILFFKIQKMLQQPKLSNIISDDFKLTKITAERKDKNESELLKLGRLERQKITFATSPADEFKELCKAGGAMSQVSDARMKGESLALRDILYP